MGDVPRPAVAVVVVRRAVDGAVVAVVPRQGAVPSEVDAELRVLLAPGEDKTPGLYVVK